MKRFASIALVGILPSALFAEPVAHLVMQSDPGDWIGQGQNYDITYTPSTSDWFFIDLMTWSPGAGPNFARFTLVNDFSAAQDEFALLDFASNQLGSPLAIGTYSNAQRASFADPGFAGLDVSYDHRGSNQLSGSFTIHDFAYSGTEGNWVLERFDASFEQHSEFATPALRGRFTYSANAVPEPATLTVLGLGAFAMMRRRKKGSA